LRVIEERFLNEVNGGFGFLVPLVINGTRWALIAGGAGTIGTIASDLLKGSFATWNDVKDYVIQHYGAEALSSIPFYHERVLDANDARAQQGSSPSSVLPGHLEEDVYHMSLFGYSHTSLPTFNPGRSGAVLAPPQNAYEA
jgi:hypothetical protein